jgi:site-specific recombinase XerD
MEVPIMNVNSELGILIKKILGEMEVKKYSSRTIKNYSIVFNRLKRLADKMGIDSPSEDLFTAFLNVFYTSVWGFKKARFHKRCVKLLRSARKTGNLDWSKDRPKDTVSLLTEPSFHHLLKNFINLLNSEGFAANTICGYKRMVIYFLVFCQEKGYKSLESLQTNDLSIFIINLYQKGYYKPTTITSALSSLRMFLAKDEHAKQFLIELPAHLPRERKIIEVYDKNEITAINEVLASENLSKRDAAICKLLLETGLRGIDICELKLTNIDWRKDIIQITQHKTGSPLIVPLRESYGNLIADYILHERPNCRSEYVFVRSLAPYEQLTVGAIWRILSFMDQTAGIKKHGRISGSRMTRHNAASSMLRSGVPMSDISSVLGHKDPNIVSVYLTTDSITLRACTLPMPPVRKGGE